MLTQFNWMFSGLVRLKKAVSLLDCFDTEKLEVDLNLSENIFIQSSHSNLLGCDIDTYRYLDMYMNSTHYLDLYQDKSLNKI